MLGAKPYRVANTDYTHQKNNSKKFACHRAVNVAAAVTTTYEALEQKEQRDQSYTTDKVDPKRTCTNKASPKHTTPRRTQHPQQPPPSASTIAIYSTQGWFSTAAPPHPT
jgi:hypothetical protein